MSPRRRNQGRFQDETPEEKGNSTELTSRHCPASPNPDHVENEQDGIDVENFLDTLTEVALAIASRQRAAEGEDGAGCGP